ncbi:TPA_asm: hypothetical protein vir515_00041 [Caudoviricetes sp. vir515]|jgi:hypothetical protein|nr:TPA_asm: hypothetical protein vir515_00041 [Caudoviricetes sp. vir515]
MTEKISWDQKDTTENTAKKQILIEKPIVERTSLARIDEEIAMMDREIQRATARKVDLVAKRKRITSALSISTKE